MRSSRGKSGMQCADVRSVSSMQFFSNMAEVVFQISRG